MSKNEASAYLRTIRSIPLLTLEEEKTLAAKAFRGDKQAQNKLVESNLRFVIKIAARYKGLMELEDLINEGSIGLMTAARKFNPESGNKFITYASWWITASIQKAVRETSTGIKFPNNKYNEMKNKKWRMSSLDETVPGKDGDEVSKVSLISDDRNLNPEEEFFMEEDRALTLEIVESLSPKEKTVLYYRYGLDGKKPLSLSETGEKMGYSKERVRQIEIRAKNLVRTLIEEGYGSEDFYCAA